MYVIHHFQFKVDPERSNEIEIKVPLIIGTVPLQQSFEQLKYEGCENILSASDDLTPVYGAGAASSSKRFPAQIQYKDLRKFIIFLKIITQCINKYNSSYVIFD